MSVSREKKPWSEIDWFEPLPNLITDRAGTVIASRDDARSYILALPPSRQNRQG